MLTEQQLDIIGEAFTDIFQTLEGDVINDIARRVRSAEKWTKSAELQAQALQRLGYSPERIRTEVIRKLNATPEYVRMIDENTLKAKALQQSAIDRAKTEIKKTAPDIFDNIGNMAFRNDLGLWKEAGQSLPTGNTLARIITEYRKRGVADMLNLTKTLGLSYPNAHIRLSRAYLAALNDALTKSLSGAYSSSEAIVGAVKVMAKSGLRKIDFASGRSYQLDSAARNAILTTSGQLAGAISEQNIKETGVEHVEVSAHWGARPSHALWQGKVYAYDDFVRTCGYGEPGNPDNIYSYHCRHSHYPFWEGISVPNIWQPEPKPVTIGGKTYTYYQATQEQRRQERNIRALKRERNAGNTIPQSMITAATKAYKDFSNKAGIRIKLNLLTVVDTR